MSIYTPLKLIEVEHLNGNQEDASSTLVNGSQRSTKEVGDVAEAFVLAALVKAKKKVLLPFGENHRYDLVVDDNGEFIRIQVKSGRIRKGVLRFNTTSRHDHRGGLARGYVGEPDNRLHLSPCRCG